MLLPPHDVFRDQLANLFYGHALWVPDLNPFHQQASIGDVGYIRDGRFVRMFNVLLEWDHASNRTFCVPEQYTPLDMGPFVNIRKSKFYKGPYYSRHVTEVNPQGVTNVATATQDECVIILSQIAVVDTSTCRPNFITYLCNKKYGALLMLPYDGAHEDIIRTRPFEDYIRDNVDFWLSFAQRNHLGVNCMEDFILVTGCTLVTSWGAAAFIDNPADAEVELKTQTLGNGGAKLDWRVVRPSVVHRDWDDAPVCSLRHIATSIR
jgi:hypothetical protein